MYGTFLPTCMGPPPLRVPCLGPPTSHSPWGARKTEHERVYTILLIITDGEITDMDETVNAIVAADDAPLTIVAPTRFISPISLLRVVSEEISVKKSVTQRSTDAA